MIYDRVMSYVVNEAKGTFARMPNMNIKVDADEYVEKGSFTVFKNSAGEEVFSMKTSEVHTIRIQ